MWFLLACGAPSDPQPLPPLGAASSVHAPVAPAPEVAAAPGPSSHRTSNGRVVAVGDLHGDVAGVLSALTLAGIVDASGAWIGGKDTLVQTGDVTDRGPDSKGVLALLRRLQGEAAAAGGAVVPLLGNHEVMNIRGDWRYVSAADLEGYGGDEKRKAAFEKSGEEGSWLATLDAVAVIDDTVFCHGGLREIWARLGTDAVNRQVREGMFALASKSLVIGDSGPMWDRTFAQAPEAEVCDELGRSLEFVGARRMVVGHTVQEDGKIHTRCDGRIVLIDTGISAHYGSHGSALQVVAGDAKALYASGVVDVSDPIVEPK